MLDTPSPETIRLAKIEDRQPLTSIDDLGGPNLVEVDDWIESIWEQLPGDNSVTAWVEKLREAIAAYETAPMSTTARYFSTYYSDLPEPAKAEFWQWMACRFEIVDDLSIPLDYWYWENLGSEAPPFVREMHAKKKWPTSDTPPYWAE